MRFDPLVDSVLRGQLLANHELIPDFWISKGRRGAFQELIPGFRTCSWLYFWGAVNSMPGLERIVVMNTNFGLSIDLLPALLQVKKPLKVFDVHSTKGQFDRPYRVTEVDLRSVQFKVIQPDDQGYLGPDHTMAEAMRRTVRL